MQQTVVNVKENIKIKQNADKRVNERNEIIYLNNH